MLFCGPLTLDASTSHGRASAKSKPGNFQRVRPGNERVETDLVPQSQVSHPVSTLSFPAWIPGTPEENGL